MLEGNSPGGRLRLLMEGWDEDHLAMAVCLQTICEAVEAGEPHEETVGLVAHLAALSAEHLLSEEEAMRRHAYPLLGQHIATHDDFRGMLGQLHRDCRDGADPTLVLDRMRHLLSAMIKEDQGLQSFLAPHAGKRFVTMA